MLSIPLCAILCCLNEEGKKRKVVRQNGGERHPMEAVALSIIQGQLANRVVYMQAAPPSLFLSLSLMHTQV